MSKNTTDTPKSHTFFKFKLDVPNLIVGSFASLILTVGGGYYFLNIEPSPDPVYKIYSHEQVVAPESSAYGPGELPIKFTDNDGNAITENVYRTDIALWNRGEKGISGSEYPDGIKIGLQMVNIIKKQVRSQSNRDVSNFQLADKIQQPNDDHTVFTVTYDNLLPDQGAVIEIWYIAKRKAEIYVNAQSMSGIDLKQLDYYGTRLLQPFVSLTSTIIFFLAVTYVTANLASEFRSRPTRISRSIFLLKRVSLALLIIWGIYTLYQVANARYIASNTPPSELFPWGAL